MCRLDKCFMDILLLEMYRSLKKWMDTLLICLLLKWDDDVFGKKIVLEGPVSCHLMLRELLIF